LIALAQGIEYFHAPIFGVDRTVAFPTAMVFAVKKVKLCESATPLTEVSFEIPLGSITAIAGPSGVGKTSLLNAMLGVNSCHCGEIEFFGERVDPSLHYEILKHVAVAPQSPKIINGTLEENLVYGAHGYVSQDFLREIVDHLCLENILNSGHQDVLALPLGVQGSNLSGGERQRISIARALVRRREILVLDEPTSALDARTSERMLDFVRSRCKTIIVVSHDPLVLSRSHRVIYLG
jgi:ATP-binding cassette subfamily B protein